MTQVWTRDAIPKVVVPPGWDVLYDRSFGQKDPHELTGWAVFVNKQAALLLGRVVAVHTFSAYGQVYLESAVAVVQVPVHVALDTKLGQAFRCEAKAMRIEALAAMAPGRSFLWIKESPL